MDIEEQYDNSICPYVPLPDDWDTYLDNQVSSNTRQKIRRFLRRVETSDEYRITVSEADTVERDIEILTRLWESKWGVSKGQVAIDIVHKIRRTMLIHCQEQGALFMPILWRDETPIGALGLLIDPVKSAMLYFVAGRDMTLKGLPSGLVLHAYSIRHAIDRNLKTYDFLRGNEPYKYSFGAQERTIQFLSISRKAAAKQLDRRCLASALLMTRDLQNAGRHLEAERGLQQILKVDPENDSARLSLGQLLMARGNRAAADKVLAGRSIDATPPKA